MTMLKESCKKYNSCECPICPMEEDTITDGIWYSDEMVCRSSDYAGERFIKSQKKLAKRGVRGYFTHGMLDRNFVVGRGTHGLDPDKAEKPQLVKWFKVHPLVNVDAVKFSTERLLKNRHPGFSKGRSVCAK